jgi:hypothetical protein
MVEDIGLIVTKVTNRVLSIMRVLKSTYSQVRQSIQV